MHFRILKMIATSGCLTALECTKFVFGHGSGALGPSGNLQRSPDPLAGLKGPTSKGRGGEGKERSREWEVKRRKGRGREVKG